jgi:hypothetical protein
MNQIVVPQFLDVEDKIIGPISVRQFLEMLFGAMIIFIFYSIFDISLFAVSTFLVGSITLIVAFVRINGQGFHYFILNFISAFTRPRLQVWRKMGEKISIAKQKDDQNIQKETGAYASIMRKTAKSSKLSELSLIVDTGGVYRGEKNNL